MFIPWKAWKARFPETGGLGAHDSVFETAALAKCLLLSGPHISHF